ncbi:MAG: cytochrome c biogenesis protein ResB [Phycisphaeraceae bacterium]|nr:cytochrome c biogenesis protein ResB [Phycisphaerales bacterium]MCB9859918.1 cytochrome c biogenesis protein ResB [Phycisphaeraceae bacterium]
MSWLRTICKPIASLKLTVALFAMSMFLVFAGTLAQQYDGVWTVVDRYFRSPIVRIPVKIFVPGAFKQPPDALAFFFPGGLTIGVVLFFNLITAHIIHFKYSLKRLGIIIMHFGVILLLAGEFVTGAFAREGNMSIYETSYSNFIEDTRHPELAIVRTSDSDETMDDVIVVPDHLLRTSGASISDDALPVDIHIDEWQSNSALSPPIEVSPERRAELLSRVSTGLGQFVASVRVPTITGVDASRVDVPACYVTFYKKGTNFKESLGSYLLSAYFTSEDVQVLDVNGTEYRVSLRFKRVYKPYEIHLIDFSHDLFVGTKTPRNFSSECRLIDRERNVDRTVKIWMNNPLRYRGETFYQQSYKPNDTGTVLQVVNNPGWLIPYISCILVAFGMMWHFGIRLSTFVRRQAR